MLSGLLRPPRKIFPRYVSGVADGADGLTVVAGEADEAGKLTSEWLLFSREPVVNMNHIPAPNTRSRTR
jgi:hypothetical protein